MWLYRCYMLWAMWQYSTYFSFLLFGLSFILGAISTFPLLTNSTWLISWSFYNPYLSSISLDIFIDLKGLIFTAVVIFISGSVLLFSSFYIQNDIFLNRFIILVVLFVLSIALLIFIPNIISFLLGWDGLGITSFCLVIYYQNAKSLAGGMLTALSNRVGDVIILIVIALILNNGTWLISNPIFSKYSFIIVLLILVAAITKRAQIPFSRWLPAAIAAPTPVSALVHSSTLVTAGVFLLIRFYPFLASFPQFSSSLLVISVATLTIAGIRAMLECDLKKIIALSTLRQLGVIIISLALGLADLAFLHLLTHAIFKALLFIAAGTLLHIFSHNQDLRTFGGLSFQLPFITRTILIANLALCGFPFMAGFYSKDLILEFMLEQSSSFLLLCLAIGGTFLTSAYSIRLRITAIWRPIRRTPQHSSSETPPTILLPLTFLTVFAITRGAIINWAYIPSPLTPFLPSTIKLLPLFVTLCGAYFTWSLTTALISLPNIFILHQPTINFLTTIWFLTPIRTQIPLTVFINITKKSALYLDHGWLELLGPQGVSKISSATLSLIQPLTRVAAPLVFLLSVLLITPLLLHYLL